MGNSLRCCLACVLPCGALDVVRVVHLSGRVEEFGRPVTAGEILAANPNHILTKPCSMQQSATAHHRILVLSPDSTLRRGSIYFLIPESSSSLQEKRRRRRRKKRTAQPPTKPIRKTTTEAIATTTAAVEDQASDDGSGLSTEFPGSEKLIPAHRRRRSARVSIWQPRLERITEDP